VKAWWPGRVFYGWRIVGAGFGIEVLIGALLFHAYGAYVVLMREEFGWSRTLFSAVFAMARAESAILGPVQGWLTDRFGPRALMRVGMTILQPGNMAFTYSRCCALPDAHLGTATAPEEESGLARRLAGRSGEIRRTGR
jgi:MFS family permease